MNLNKKRIAVLGFVGYIACYVVFRQTQSEVWKSKNPICVIFPENKILYYVYRPLTIVDANLAGMKFHIGPHQPNGNY